MPDPEPAPPKAVELFETAADPAMVSVSTSALLIASMSTLAAVIGVSVTVARMVCVISFTATDAPTEPAVVPPWDWPVLSAKATPPESEVMSELSSAWMLSAPVVAISLSAPTSASTSLSTRFTVTAPAPANLMSPPLELCWFDDPVSTTPAIAITSVSMSVAPCASSVTPPPFDRSVLSPSAVPQTDWSESITATDPVRPTSPFSAKVPPPASWPMVVWSVPRMVMPCRACASRSLAAASAFTSTSSPSTAFVSPFRTAMVTAPAIPMVVLLPPPDWLLPPPPPFEPLLSDPREADAAMASW